MVIITVKAYENAGVHTITVENKKLFWVKMIDAQNGLGLKNISDLVRRKICGIFEKNDLTENEKNKYIRSEYEITKKLIDNKQNKYARSDIMEEIIKNCRGVKICNDGINRTEKENQRLKKMTYIKAKNIE